MTERGYICLDRGALNHEFFRRKEHSEFEAWVWLLTEAAWKPRDRRIGEFMVSLERGQLVASIRYLMSVWSWSKGKVERFIARLKSETMIGTCSETGINVITICNYDRYQATQKEHGTAASTPTGTVVGQGRGQSWDTHGDNTEEIKHLNIETVVVRAPALVFESDWPKDFQEEFWREYPKRVDKAAAFKKLDQMRRAGKVSWRTLIAGVKRYAAKVQGKDQTYTKGPAAWLNAGKWDDEDAPVYSLDEICPPEIYRNVL